MSNEEALQAMRTGDFEKAAGLLGPIVEENRFSSDILNHAYTLALHQSNSGDLPIAAFRIARSLSSTKPGIAADYFQRAMLTGIDQKQIQEVSEWQGTLATEGIHKPGREVRTDRVAHVMGCFLPGHAPSLYVQLLARSLKQQGVRSHVFTTEWTSSWFFNPPGVVQSDPPEVDAEVTVARVDGDFFERAERIGEAIRASEIDILLYHCGPSEQITVRVAALHPAAIQINVNHAEEVSADLFEGFAHLFQNGLERTLLPNRPKRWIPLISDIEDRLKTSTPMSRSELGLESAGTVSATFGNLFKASEAVHLETITRILREQPAHFHVIAGAGDPTPIRNYFEGKGVIDQVRFVEHVPDIAGMLGMVDIYLNSFPVSAGQSILEAMAASIPAVIRKYPHATHYNVGAELAGLPELLADSEDDYVQITGELIREPAFRLRCGAELKTRFQAEFRPEGLGAKYVDFINEIVAGVGG